MATSLLNVTVNIQASFSLTCTDRSGQFKLFLTQSITPLLPGHLLLCFPHSLIFSLISLVTLQLPLLSLLFSVTINVGVSQGSVHSSIYTYSLGDFNQFQGFKYHLSPKDCLCECIYLAQTSLLNFRLMSKIKPLIMFPESALQHYSLCYSILLVA